MAEHSKLSFSSRARWANCPFSVKLSEGLPDSTSPAAEEGTIAHTVAEQHLRKALGQLDDVPTDELIAPPPGIVKPESMTYDAWTKSWNADLHKHGRGYAEFILKQIPGALQDAHVAIEQRVAIPSIHPQLHGTADCVIYAPQAEHLAVIDYKFGFQPVDIGDVADTNPQLAAYLVAAAEVVTEPLELLRVSVYQPRLTTMVPQVLELPITWLKREREKLKREVDAVENAAEPNPGEWCRYCKAKQRCPATVNALQTVVQARGTAPDLANMGEDQVLALWAARTAFKAFWEDVEERITQMAAAKHPRIEVKEKRGRQMWADPKEAALYFLAIDRLDLLQPVAIGEALEALPQSVRAELVTLSKGSRTLTVKDPDAPDALAEKFKMYAIGNS